MKATRVVKMVAVAFAMTLGTAVAQQTTTTTTRTDPVTGTTTTESSTVSDTGTIMAYTPRSDYITFQSETDPAPARYYYTKETVIRDPGGRIVTWSAVRPDLPATVYYVRQGDRLIVQKILLRRPGTVYERRVTTTTTTTNQP